MFYYKLVFGLTLITISLTNPLIDNVSNQPKRCCLAEQYSAKYKSSMELGLPDGTMQGITSFTGYVYDRTRGLMGMRYYSASNESQLSYWMIEDRNAKKVYTIYPEYNMCYNYTNSREPTDCIPETATYVGSSTYQLNGQDMIGDTWVYEAYGLTIYQTYSRESCIQLKVEYTQNEPLIKTSTITTEYSESIVDPTLLEVPAQCFN